MKRKLLIIRFWVLNTLSFGRYRRKRRAAIYAYYEAVYRYEFSEENKRKQQEILNHILAPKDGNNSKEFSWKEAFPHKLYPGVFSKHPSAIAKNNNE